MKPFFDRLSEEVEKHRTALCVGIDPHMHFADRFLTESVNEGPAGLEMFSFALVDAATDLVPAVKFQSSFYERFGSEGYAVLERSIARAKEKNLIAILDNKRGDISSTMSAYAEATFVHFGADAMTVTPYMGLDCLRPLQSFLEAGKGAYVVWHTSNPSADAVQNVLTENQEPFYVHLLEEIYKWAVEENLNKSIGYVLGATKCEHINNELVPLLASKSQNQWLMPGFGAQGAKMSPKLKIFTQDSRYLIPVSRGLYSSDKELTSWENFGLSVRSNIEKFKGEFKI